MSKFKVGDIVLYQNGSTFELGRVKEVMNGTLNQMAMFGSEEIVLQEAKYRVWYHTGDTTAVTSESMLHKISNDYVFMILRRDADESLVNSDALKLVTALADTISKEDIYLSDKQTIFILAETVNFFDVNEVQEDGE